MAIAASTGAVGNVSSGAVGAANAVNVLTNTVFGFIDNSTVIAAGAIEVQAHSKKDGNSDNIYRVDALAFGIALAGLGSKSQGLTGAYAGAGSLALNQVDIKMAGYLLNSTLRAGQALTVSAFDDIRLRADSGGYALSLALSSGAGTNIAGAIGASIALNEIGEHGGHEVRAFLANVDASVGGDVLIDAQSVAAIEAVSIGAAGSGAFSKGSGLNLALSGAGAGSYNRIKIDIEASLKQKSTLIATDAAIDPSVTLRATDQSEIFTDAGGVVIAVAAGIGSLAGQGAAISIGVANAENIIDNTTHAFIADSTVTADGAVTVEATAKDRSNSGRDYRIDALAFGIAASGAVSSGEGLAGAIAGAGSGVLNTVDNSVLAYIEQTLNADENDEIIAGGNLAVTAADATRIRGDAGGYAIALSGSTGSVNTGAGAIGASIVINEIGKNGGYEVKEQ